MSHIPFSRDAYNSRGKRECGARGCDARRRIIRCDLRFIGGVRRQPAQCREKKERTRQEAQQRQAKRIATRGVRALMRENGRELVPIQQFNQSGVEKDPGAKPARRKRGIGQSRHYPNSRWIQSDCQCNVCEGWWHLRDPHLQPTQREMKAIPRSPSVPHGVEDSPEDEHV